jgi:hypothetical protein
MIVANRAADYQTSLIIERLISVACLCQRQTGRRQTGLGISGYTLQSIKSVVSTFPMFCALESSKPLLIDALMSTTHKHI